MSIAPPSDVVLDVAQAADPQKVRAATARLVQLGAGAAAGDDFAAQLASVGRTGSSGALSTSLPFSGAGRSEMPHKGSPYEKFEAMMLQNFIEEILPKDSDLFGDATSADAYRSMLADQLATQLAKTGRLGVAHAIERAESVHAAAANQPVQLQPGSAPSRSSEPAAARTPA